MKQMPDPDKLYEKHSRLAAFKYVAGLKKHGLQRSPIVEKRIAKQVSRDAAKEWDGMRHDVLKTNVESILDNLKRDRHEINVRDRNEKLKIVLPFAVLVAILAIVAHTHPSGFIVGADLLLSVFALVLIAVVAWSVIQAGK